jgi:cytoskeletal protein CcmA (bactofilin family)
MFSKSSNRSTPELPSRNQLANLPSHLTIVAQGVEISGNLVTTGEVQLDGVLKGDIRCGALTIGEGGVLVGSVISERAVIRGSVQGLIHSKSAVLERTAQVTGDITHETLTVHEGAQLDGRLIRRSDPHLGDLPIGGAADSQPALKAV